MPDAREAGGNTVPEVITFGCRLNTYESEVIREVAAGRRADRPIIVNTCAVTAEAERQARQAIRRARRRRPEAEIVVTGCAVQIDPDRFAAMPEVDRVLGNREKLLPASYVPDAGTHLVSDIMTVPEVRETAGHLVDGLSGRARAFVQVQQGCDHRCTFCVIPFGRGPSRSVPMGEVARQVQRLVDNGYREVVLTGVDITAYGDDLPGRPRLGQLVRRLLKAVPDLPRLRLTSLDPVEVDDELLRLIGDEPRLMPHLHLSLQAGDDMVLKRMRRRHLRRDVEAFCAAARRRRPDVVFGADLIAGFPTETEAMFRNTLDLVDRLDLTYLHVFPYSERPGTPAARMPQVGKAERRARARTLRQAGDKALERFLEGRVGTAASVLAEAPQSGRSEHFAPVALDRAVTPGAVVTARIDGVADGRLVGTVTS